MWYVSASSWDPAPGGPRHRYNIRYADSEDGVRWDRRRGAVIDYATAEEHAFSRPFVVHDADGYRMWYAYRGQRYRIGCARSRDGLTWTRCDDGSLDPSGEEIGRAHV